MRTPSVDRRKDVPEVVCQIVVEVEPATQHIPQEPADVSLNIQTKKKWSMFFLKSGRSPGRQSRIIAVEKQANKSVYQRQGGGSNVG